MHLMSGCLRSLSWLPVLSNVASPSLYRKATNNKMLQIIEANPNWHVYANVFDVQFCPLWSDVTPVDTTAQ